MRGIRSRRSTGQGERIFFATDIHGSDRCFRKFINAAKAYDVQALVLGGDIIGKTLIPIWRSADGWNAEFSGHTYVAMTEQERNQLERSIRDRGQYPVIGEYDELAALSDESVREARFAEIAVESVQRWVELAEERLGGTGVQCFMAPGNDDFWEVDKPLRNSSVIQFAEGSRLRISDHNEIITTGFSNPTPWVTPRELEEPALEEVLEAMFAEVEDPERLIAVTHAPPRDSRLDQARQLDADLAVQNAGGEAIMVPVGSTAVREFILRRQPMLSLHGHVHESKASELIGRTLCINPGSEYHDGTLAGALITLTPDGQIAAHQLLAG